MTVNKEKLTAVKAYMRIDGSEDDAIIKALYSAAVLYLKNTGIEAMSADPSLYNLAVWRLTLHYYDHRDAVGNEADFPAGLRPIINQLKLMGDVERSLSMTDLSDGSITQL